MTICRLIDTENTLSASKKKLSETGKRSLRMTTCRLSGTENKLSGLTKGSVELAKGSIVGTTIGSPGIKLGFVDNTVQLQSDN